MLTPLFVLCLVSFTVPSGSVITFEGDSFPETSGWTRSVFLTPQRTLENGILIQYFDSVGDHDFYRRFLSAFSASTNFFAEWRVQSDAPSTLLDSFQIPAGFVLSGNTGVTYHFRFTDSLGLFTRSDNSLFFFPLEPHMFHTYRVELLENDSYRFLIDGRLVDSGEQSGPYPTLMSEIIWGGRFYEPNQTIQWDYIRYGTIPEPATATLHLIGTTLWTLRRKSRTR